MSSRKKNPICFVSFRPRNAEESEAPPRKHKAKNQQFHKMTSDRINTRTDASLPTDQNIKTMSIIITIITAGSWPKRDKQKTGETKTRS